MEDKKETTIMEEPKIQSEESVENTEVKDSVEWEAPKSKEEYEVALKSASNKAKTEILKDLGVVSIKEFKQLQGEINEKMETYDSLIKEKESLSESKEELTRSLNQLKRENVLNKHSISDEYREDIITLANSKVNEENDFETVISELVDGKYKYMVNNSNTVSLGTEKGEETKESTSRKLSKRYPWIK